MISNTIVVDAVKTDLVLKCLSKSLCYVSARNNNNGNQHWWSDYYEPELF